MRHPRKKKVIPLFTIDLHGDEFEGVAELPFYDIVKEGSRFVIRYYGCCAVKTMNSLEEAKQYIREKSAHLRKEINNEQRAMHQ